MQRWECRNTKTGKTRRLPDYLNQIGNDGWELVGAITAVNWDYGRLFFKRPRP